MKVLVGKSTSSNYAVLSKGTYYVYEASDKVLGMYEKKNYVVKLKPNIYTDIYDIT
ncbi:MAG: hypothetical protein JNL32_13090 [Candidatus Kapabacteria bacterium]|nr:hypothetical protein [Candidatus Kapabacteria bacterium]